MNESPQSFKIPAIASEPPPALSDFDEEAYRIPLLMQRDLMLFMIPLDMSRDTALDFSDGSALQTVLLQHWIEKYGKTFRDLITDLPRETAELKAIAERIDSGQLDEDDYETFKSYLEISVERDEEGRVVSGGVFLGDAAEIAAALALVKA